MSAQERILRDFDKAFEIITRVATAAHAEPHNTCSCGATIEADETSCRPCRDDENGEAKSELARLFPRGER